MMVREVCRQKQEQRKTEKSPGNSWSLDPPGWQGRAAVALARRGCHLSSDSHTER